MKKTVSLLTFGVILGNVVHAQSVEDGVKALYDGKMQTAIAAFQKNADKPEATYWLAETYFKQQDAAKANDVIAKATKPTDAYVLVAKGKSLLMQNKVAEAKQSFDAAIAAAGKDEVDKARILNAVGKANFDGLTSPVKAGDVTYAVQKLEEAKSLMAGVKEKKQDKWLMADIATNLGDAYILANPGDGSKAFTSFQDALLLDPTFARAEFRKAMIFKSQRNLDLYLQSLNKAVAANPNYVTGYNELYAYQIGTDPATAQKTAEKIIALNPGDPNNDYFKAQTAFINKQYDQAITSAKNVIANGKDMADPKAYKVIAYSLLAKKDTAGAVPFVEDYFKKQSKEELMPQDYTMMAMAYSTSTGKEADIVKRYMDGISADTSVANKVEILTEGAKFFAAANKGSLAGELYAKILEVKPADKLTINDYFNAGYSGFYKAGQFEKAWKVFDAARTKFPKWNYGYMLTYGSSKVFDSSNAKNIMIPDAEKYIAFLQSPNDTSAAQAKRAEIFKTSVSLFTYYANVKKDNANTLKYLQLAYNNADDATAKEQVAGYIKQLGGTPGAGSPATMGSSTSQDSTKAAVPKN